VLIFHKHTVIDQLIFLNYVKTLGLQYVMMSLVSPIHLDTYVYLKIFWMDRNVLIFSPT